MPSLGPQTVLQKQHLPGTKETRKFAPSRAPAVVSRGGYPPESCDKTPVHDTTRLRAVTMDLGIRCVCVLAMVVIMQAERAGASMHLTLGQPDPPCEAYQRVLS